MNKDKDLKTQSDEIIRLKAESKEKDEIIKEFNLILLDEYPHLSTKNLNKYRKAVDKRNKLLNN